MQEFSYDSDLIGGSLLVRESRVIAELLLEQANEEQWKQAIQTENRLQKRSPATAKRQAGALRKRLERLDEPFWRALRDGDDERGGACPVSRPSPSSPSLASATFRRCSRSLLAIPISARWLL